LLRRGACRGASCPIRFLQKRRLSTSIFQNFHDMYRSWFSRARAPPLPHQAVYSFGCGSLTRAPWVDSMAASTAVQVSMSAYKAAPRSQGTAHRDASPQAQEKEFKVARCRSSCVILQIGEAARPRSDAETQAKSRGESTEYNLVSAGNGCFAADQPPPPATNTRAGISTPVVSVQRRWKTVLPVPPSSDVPTGPIWKRQIHIPVCFMTSPLLQLDGETMF